MEITEWHGRKDEKKNWPWILKSNCKRFFATEGAEILEQHSRNQKKEPPTFAQGYGAAGEWTRILLIKSNCKRF